MLKKFIYFIILVLTFTSCATPSNPVPIAESSNNSNIDTAFVNSVSSSQYSVIPEKPHIVSQQPLQTEPSPEPQSTSTLNLEIKENIVLDKSLTFYYYMPTSNNGYKSDKVFYFLLNESTLTLQQYDKNMSLTLQGDFTVTKPWGRTLTVDYNILKTSLSSSNNKEISFEIGLKNSKVSYVKLGDNKFYAKEPSKPVISPSVSNNNSNLVQYHIINAGENIKALAESNCTSVRSILNLNPKVDKRKDYIVYPGERIRIK